MVLIVGAVAIAALVGFIVGRRRPDSPSTPTTHIPGQLDRNDFTRPAAPWLVAVFTSETCSTCAGVWEQALPLGGAEVAVQELEAGRDVVIHERYGIDAVPTLLIADGEGVVRRWFVGPVSSTDLRAGIAEARRPGSVRPGSETGETGH